MSVISRLKARHRAVYKIAQRLIAIGLIALFDVAGASAQLTRNQLQNNINTTITANGHNAITGPILNVQLNNFIPSFGSITDANNWLGANAFPSITLGGNGGSTWPDFGSGVFYYTPLKDRTDVGVQGGLTFRQGSNVLGPPGTYYLDRAAVLRATSPLGLGGVYGTCQSSRASAGNTPAWFSVTGPTTPTSGGSGGTGPATYTGVLFAGGSGNSLQRGDVTVSSGGVATAIAWQPYIASGSGGYVIGDVLTPATPLPSGLPAGISVTVTAVQGSYCFGGAFVATNDSIGNYAHSANGIYVETLRTAGAGNTGALQILTGNGGAIFGETPYPAPAAYNAGLTYNILMTPGGSAGIAPSIYVNPISADIIFSNVPGGHQAMIGEVYVNNCCLDAQTPLRNGSSLTRGMVPIAFAEGHKLAWFDSNGSMGDNSVGYGYIGSYLQGDVANTSVVENISFEAAVKSPPTFAGIYAQGPGFFVTKQEQPYIAVSLDGVNSPMFQVLGNGATAQALYEGAGNTGAGSWVSHYVLTRGAGPGPGTPVVAGDNALLKGWGDDGTKFKPFAQIAIQVAGTVSTGVVPGSIILSTANPSGAMTQAAAITQTQTLISYVAFTYNTIQANTNYSVSTLPTCNSGASGTMAYVTDALTPTYGAALTGGSSTRILALCNGANWTAH